MTEPKRRPKTPSNPARRVIAPPLARHTTPPDARPVWDADRRELRLDETIIVAFHRPTPVLERILVAFQEENWPVRIDDPLPYVRDLGGRAAGNPGYCYHGKWCERGMMGVAVFRLVRENRLS